MNVVKASTDDKDCTLTTGEGEGDSIGISTSIFSSTSGPVTGGSISYLLKDQQNRIHFVPISCIGFSNGIEQILPVV